MTVGVVKKLLTFDISPYTGRVHHKEPFQKLLQEKSGQDLVFYGTIGPESQRATFTPGAEPEVDLTRLAVKITDLYIDDQENALMGTVTPAGPMASVVVGYMAHAIDFYMAAEMVAELYTENGQTFVNMQRIIGFNVCLQKPSDHLVYYPRPG